MSKVVVVGSLHLYVGETTVHVVFSSFRLRVLIEGFEVVCFVFVRLGQSVVRQLRRHQGKGLSLVFRMGWRVQTMRGCGVACILGVLLRRVRGSSRFPMCLP